MSEETEDIETVRGVVVTEQVVGICREKRKSFGQLINNDLSLTLPKPGRYKVVRVEEEDE